MDKYSIEKSWEFWKDIICHEDGSINIEQLKLELCDSYLLINEVPKVYDEVTGGLLSKPYYYADTIVSIFNERYGNKAAGVDCLPDDWDDITADCETNEDYKKAIFEYLDCEKD